MARWTLPSTRRCSLALVALALVSPGNPALAQSEAPAESAWDRVWSHTRLYENSGEGVIRSIDLSGRLHIDAGSFDADQGDWDDILWRRFRFGFKAELAGDWKLHLEGAFNLDDFDDDFYGRLTDAYVGWEPGKHLKMKLLKHSAGFTLDGATSSKKLLTPQRNNVTRNLWFTAEYFTGASVMGELDNNWTYRAGVFSTDGENEFSAFSASFFSLASVGYDFSPALGMKEANIRLDYVYNDEHQDSNTPDFSHVVSLSSQWQGDAWGLRTDLAAGEGHFGQSDIYGLSLMPWYSFTDLVQGVLRYTYMSSSDSNGLRLGRYEQEIVSGLGDRYNEYFAGLNVFFYDHKFKWQTGLQYTTMDDRANDGGEYDGWGITTVLRIYW